MRSWVSKIPRGREWWQWKPAQLPAMRAFLFDDGKLVRGGLAENHVRPPSGVSFSVEREEFCLKPDERLSSGAPHLLFMLRKIYKPEYRPGYHVARIRLPAEGGGAAWEKVGDPAALGPLSLRGDKFQRAQKAAQDYFQDAFGQAAASERARIYRAGCGRKPHPLLPQRPRGKSEQDSLLPRAKAGRGTPMTSPSNR